MSYKIDLEGEVRKILNEYGDKVAVDTGKAISKVARNSVKKLKSKSPVRKKNGGAYAQGWTYRFEKGKVIYSATVYGKRDTYPLAHLLEHGHALRNGKRGGQREHIKPVETEAIEELYTEIKKAVEG